MFDVDAHALGPEGVPRSLSILRWPSGSPRTYRDLKSLSDAGVVRNNDCCRQLLPATYVMGPASGAILLGAITKDVRLP